MDLHVEELAPDVVEGQLAFEADAVGQLVRVDRLQLALDAVGVVDFLRHGVSGGVVEAVVSRVQPDVRGQDRVLLHMRRKSASTMPQKRSSAWPAVGLETAGGERALPCEASPDAG